MRLIDADALRDRILGWFHRDSQDADIQDDMAASVIMGIDAAPTVDPVRHARWLPVKDDYGRHHQGQCSNCGCEPLRNPFHSPWMYCPNCGARMDMEVPDE